MVQYLFELKLEDSNTTQPSYSYSLDLNPLQEDNPSQIFTPEIRQSMRKTLQNKSSCRISDLNLNRIISAWIEDIREGYRRTQMALNLPLLIGDEINHLKEDGNRLLPELISPDLSNIEPQDGALPPLNFV